MLLSPGPCKNTRRFFKLTRIGAGIRQHVCGENQLRRVLWSENSSARAQKEMPQFAGYEKKAPNRVIPVVRLDS